MVLPLDILTRIFLFLTKEQVRHVRMVNREFREIVSRTPFFSRDYLKPGAFLDWLNFPKVYVGICRFGLTKYLSTRPELVRKTLKIAYRLGALDIIDYICKNWDLEWDHISETRIACRYGHLDIVKRLPTWDLDYIAIAAAHNHLHIVNWALSRPIDDWILAKQKYQAVLDTALGETGDPKIAHRLITAGANPNKALNQACLTQKFRIVELLLNSKYPWSPSDFNDAIITASSNGSRRIARSLLQAGANPNASVYMSPIPIFAASRKGYYRIVRLLMKAGADASIHNNCTIIAAAGYIKVVKALLKDPRVNPSAGENYAIQYASEHGHTQVVERLLQDSRVDPSANNNYAIRHAGENGHIRVVERLLQDPRVDPGADNNYAIRWASENGHIQVVERLLQDPRVDPSADDNYALKWASHYGHIQIVERLLRDPRVDPSANNNCAIRWASENGHIQVVERLLQDPRVDPSAE